MSSRIYVVTKNREWLVRGLLLVFEPNHKITCKNPLTNRLLVRRNNSGTPKVGKQLNKNRPKTETQRGRGKFYEKASNLWG